MSQASIQLGGGSAAALAERMPPLSWQAALEAASRCLYCFDAPCAKACPSGIDPSSFIRKITTGNMRGAARVIMEANVLAGSCARVCPVEELCEGACVLQKDNQAPVAIGRLQRFVTDWTAERGVKVISAGKETGKKVAVVGGGPSGLTCAAELTKLGHKVTVFEAREMAGGLNTYGIVPLRLQVADSLAEVEMVRALGVEIKTGTVVGNDVRPADLLRVYDAVFLGLGLGKGWKLAIPGEELEGVYEALDLLAAAKTGQVGDKFVGKRVAVVGGGNTAIDAATVSKRLGAEEVTVLYRRTEKEMPAYRPELDFARLEGIQFQWLTAPVCILGEQAVTGLECVRMSLGAPDETGRPRPVPVAGTERVMALDIVIRAVGQSPSEGLAAELGVEVRRGLIQADPETGRTSNPKVFAGGDCVRGGSEVVFAVQGGKRAALGIHAAIMGARC
jgi:dihydropyrimidine dehydrogenase (NAD+) subunit PreT